MCAIIRIKNMASFMAMFFVHHVQIEKVAVSYLKVMNTNLSKI